MLFRVSFKQVCEFSLDHRPQNIDAEVTVVAAVHWDAEYREWGIDSWDVEGEYEGPRREIQLGKHNLATSDETMFGWIREEAQRQAEDDAKKLVMKKLNATNDLLAHLANAAHYANDVDLEFMTMEDRKELRTKYSELQERLRKAGVAA